MKTSGKIGRRKWRIKENKRIDQEIKRKMEVLSNTRPVKKIKWMGEENKRYKK